MAALLRAGRAAAIGMTTRKVEMILMRRGAASPGKGVHSSETRVQNDRKSAASPTRENNGAKISRIFTRGVSTRPAAKVRAPPIGARMNIERCDIRSARGAATKATPRPSLNKRLAASAEVLSAAFWLVMCLVTDRALSRNRKMIGIVQLSP